MRAAMGPNGWSRPPLWLASAATAAGTADLFGVMRWLEHFRTAPNQEDIRIWIVAARIGLQSGWSRIYDLELERTVSGNPGPIDSHQQFLAFPETAWLMIPLAGAPVSMGFLVWTLISVAAFVGAGWLVIPGSRFARLTVLLVSLALWPVHYQFWLGQWVALAAALLAVCWWLLQRGRWTAAGVLLALAFLAKPQDLYLLPLALLVSGRWRPVAIFAVTTAVFAAVSAATIGPSGVAAWIHDLALARADVLNAPLTYFYIFGATPATVAVEFALGAAALATAWITRDRLDIVFALGVVGTTAFASYLHEYDVAILVVPAWVILGSAPTWAQRTWLLAGVVAAQFIAIGLPLPMLLWEPVWIGLLGVEPRLQRLALARGDRRPSAGDSGRIAELAGNVGR